MTSKIIAIIITAAEFTVERLLGAILERPSLNAGAHNNQPIGPIAAPFVDEEDEGFLLEIRAQQLSPALPGEWACSVQPPQKPARRLPLRFTDRCLLRPYWTLDSDPDAGMQP